MGTQPPDRPPDDGERLWVDPEWWRDVLRTEPTEEQAGPTGDDPLTAPWSVPGPDAAEAAEPDAVSPPPADAPPDEGSWLDDLLGPPQPPPGDAPPVVPPPVSTTGRPAPPARPLRVPRVTGSPRPAQPEPRTPSTRSAKPPRERRSVRDVIGPRAADAALVLLAVAVLVLVYLALSR